MINGSFSMAAMLKLPEATHSWIKRYQQVGGASIAAQTSGLVWFALKRTVPGND